MRQSNNRQPIIAGLDPGTTTGFAILSLDGKIISIGSSKDYSLSDIIRIITDYGIVVAVGCDKSKIPSFVEKFSRQLGSRIIIPKKDLLIEEKKSLVDISGTKTKDSHQFDALASAFFVHKRLKSLIRKIKIFVDRNNKQNIASMIYSHVIKEKIGIKTAINLIETPESKESRVITKIINDKRPEKNDYLLLAEKNNDLTNDIKILRSKYNDIKKKLRKAFKEKDAFEKLLRKNNSNKKIKIMRKDFSELQKKIQILEAKNSKMLESLNLQNKFLFSIDDYQIIKRVSDLGKSFIKEAENIFLRKGDIIFVDNPSIVSEKSYNILKKNVTIIISDQRFPRILQNKGFILVNSESLNLNVFSDIVFGEKKTIEKIRLDKKNLKSIVDDYQRSRSLNNK